MNKRIFVALSSFFGAISLPSCSDDVSVQLDILGADEYVQIYMPSAGRLENIKTVYIQEDVQSFDVSAYYGGPKYPTQDLFIEFEFRPDLVDAFNEKNGPIMQRCLRGVTACPSLQ